LPPYMFYCLHIFCFLFYVFIAVLLNFLFIVFLIKLFYNNSIYFSMYSYSSFRIIYVNIILYLFILVNISFVFYNEFFIFIISCFHKKINDKNYFCLYYNFIFFIVMFVFGNFRTVPKSLRASCYFLGTVPGNYLLQFNQIIFYI